MIKSKHILTIYQMRGGRKTFAKRILNQTIKRAGRNQKSYPVKKYAKTLAHIEAVLGMIQAYVPPKKHN